MCFSRRPGRGARRPAGMRPPFSFVLTKENAPRPVEEKTALTNRRTRFRVLLFVCTGVVRVGPAGVGGPVVPAPHSDSRRGWSPHSSPRWVDGERNRIGVFLLPRFPLYPQGVRRIRKAAELPTAAQLLGAGPVAARVLTNRGMLRGRTHGPQQEDIESTPAVSGDQHQSPVPITAPVGKRAAIGGVCKCQGSA